MPINSALKRNAAKVVKGETVTLWDAFNNIQNHILNGGITYTLASKRQQTVRAITNVDLKIKINEELWEVTQGYVKLKQKVY